MDERLHLVTLVERLPHDQPADAAVSAEDGDVHPVSLPSPPVRQGGQR